METRLTELTMELPSFPDVQGALISLGLEMDAAECHGALCGFICATPDAENPANWLAQVLLSASEERGEEKNELKISEKYALLLEMHATSVRNLQDPDCTFKLLLPADNEPIIERADFLATWCEGFLYGMSVGGVQSAESFDDDINEVIRDIIEISQLSSEASDDPEMDEAAYIEISEYIRAAVMLIYTELQMKRASMGGSSTLRTLH